ncbi:Epoxide hydrolase [Arcticibacter svalbardensis MN12-7]|uniref:Epoxide hydrolase n=1 Tax=Arcticibacter svalbardensis MN12-7 TaxID=1150600 RepID=R9GT96_9SPHI|nr:epoxide hydrolase N-terminal domain-containing protein [Arcticibacter svalbardensis]EOR95077.1 Epoxide hydrolase [Arcticibacter svalbardensis MN12-7]
MAQPFSADIPQQLLDDLKLRLENIHWPDEIIDSEWEYGANLSYMKELSQYWHDTFDWRQVEREINAEKLLLKSSSIACRGNEPILALRCFNNQVL